MMTVKDAIKLLKKMPRDIPVFVETINPDTGKWGNHHIDHIGHHHHENENGDPTISECVIMPNFEKCYCGILKDDGTYMTDEELKQYFYDQHFNNG